MRNQPIALTSPLEISANGLPKRGPGIHYTLPGEAFIEIHKPPAAKPIVGIQVTRVVFTEDALHFQGWGQLRGTDDCNIPLAGRIEMSRIMSLSIIPRSNMFY